MWLSAIKQDMGKKPANWINAMVLAIFVISVIPAATHATHMTPLDPMPSDQMADANDCPLHAHDDHHSQDHKQDVDSMSDCCLLTSCNSSQYSVYTDFSSPPYKLKSDFMIFDQDVKAPHTNRLERPPTA